MRLAPLVGLAVTLGLLVGAPSLAEANDPDYIPDEVIKKKKKKGKKKKPKPKDGWHPDLDAGFTFAFSQSQGVVGVPDGVTMALGLQLKGGLIFRKGGHEWVSRLNIVHTQSKVPNIDVFIKSADALELSSLYQYRFPKVRWVGVFAGVRMITALLPGSLVPTADVNLELTPDDTTDPFVLAEGQKPYKLTEAFSPLMLKQFLGGLLKPLEKKWMTIDFRLGFGAVEAFTRSGYVLKDDDTTPELELKQLQDYQQAGLEAQLHIGGVAFDKIVSYAFQAEVMIPFVTGSIETELKGADLINTEFRFMVGVKLWKWFSLNYALAVLRVPLIQEEWQITNSLMLAVKASILK